jgi:hypothetical protein
MRLASGFALPNTGAFWVQIWVQALSMGAAARMGETRAADPDTSRSLFGHRPCTWSENPEYIAVTPD